MTGGIVLPSELLFIILVQEDVEETKPVVNIKTTDNALVRKAENNGRYTKIYNYVRYIYLVYKLKYFFFHLNTLEGLLQLCVFLLRVIAKYFARNLLYILYVEGPIFKLS